MRKGRKRQARRFTRTSERIAMPGCLLIHQINPKYICMSENSLPTSFASELGSNRKSLERKRAAGRRTRRRKQNNNARSTEASALLNPRLI